jgi:mono/diheme cytochrome c family protein
MNLFKVVLIIFAGIVLVACSKPDPAPPASPPPSQSAATQTPDQFAVVRGIYAKECASCHGETAEGKTVEVEGKKIKAPPLRSGHALNHSDKDFSQQITKGGDGMPAFEKKMSAKEIEDMIRFIRKEFQNK